jgi:arabinogalactan oligomer/maltooligosaccharide transport system substrate-binding protein
MKKRTKLVALLMAMVLVMGSMTACGGDDSKSDNNNTSSDDNKKTETQDVTLTVWAPQEDQKDYSDVDSKFGGKKLLEYMCDQFNEEHPEWNITFKYAVCGEADAKTQVTKDVAAAADVYMYPGDQVQSLADAGALLPIADQQLTDVKANNEENALSAVTIDNKVYGVPFTPNTWFLYYDKSKYNENDVKSLDTMLAKDLGKCQYNFAMDLDNSWYIGGFFASSGTKIFERVDDKTCKSEINDEKGLGAAKAILSLVQNKKVLCDDDSQAAISNANKGNCAAFCSGTWSATAAKEAYGKNYAATKLPTVTINGEEVQLDSVGSYKYIGVNPNTENAQAAQALAIYLASEDCQLARFKARGVSPTWTALADQVKDDVATVAQSEQLQYMYITPQDKTFNNNFWPTIDSLGKGMLNKETTDKNLQKQLDQVAKSMVTDLTQK